jgi:serine/threonine-protein kinase
MIDTGTRIAGYRVERLLGAGGMGTVYLAIQESLSRPVALKLLSPQLTSDETFRARFRREGEVQAALDHPHIVPVYEAGATDDGLFLAMRYVRGSTLKDLVEGGELDPARTLRLLTPVAGALDAAHAAGLIHRDVKPQNILVDQTDWPYLADFGLTRGNAGGPTRTGQMVGTFAYIAPEQIKGMKASARSDQYALATVLFECLAGEMPHNHESDAALLYAKVHEDPPRLSQRLPKLPNGFDEVLARGMAREPEDRFASASALLAAANEAIERAEVVVEPAPARLDLTPKRYVAPAPIDTPAPYAAPAPITPPRYVAPAPIATPLPAPPLPFTPPPHQPSQDTVLVDVGAPQTATPRLPRPPDQPREPRHALSVPGWLIPAAACAATAIGFGLATALAGGGSDGGTTSKAAAISAGAITMKTPPQWVSTSQDIELPGLSLRRARAYAPKAGAPAGLVVGLADGSGTTLLPAAFRRALPADRSAQSVRIGRLEALRYESVRPRGVNRTVTVLASPTMTGVATIVCLGDAEQRAICETATGTARAAGGVTALPLGPRPSYAKAATAILAALAGRRTRDRATFRAARTNAGQAKAAKRLSQDYAAAARAFSGLPAGPRERPAQARIAAALKSVSSRLADLSSAASAARTAQYSAARARVLQRENAVRRAVALLDDVGYRIR